MTAKNIVGKECRFVVHIPTNHPNRPDIHLVKECIHYEDGTTAPNIRKIVDYKRPFWVTKPAKRIYEQKPEWEHEDNLLCKNVTQSKLRDAVAQSLDKSWSKDQLKGLSNSPYLFGTDVSSCTFIKKAYQDKYPNVVSGYSVATFDIETDVVHGTDEAIMASLCFKDKVFIAVKKDVVAGISMLQERFDAALRKYIGTYIDKRNITVELYVATDVVDLIKTTLGKAHLWQPDFLAIWNMNYDIPKIIANLAKYNIDPKDVFCAPSVPPSLRICKYKQGMNVKVTASGKSMPLNPAMQWHTLECTSSFYVIDAMCAYKHIRLSKQEEPSYSLNAILNKELDIQKLSFTEADAYSGLRWHQFMQTHYKVEYMVYNIFDSLSMLELDEKTKDLSYTLPSFSAASEFSSFRSQPKRIADAFFFFNRETNRLISSATGRIQEEEPDEILDESLEPEEVDTFMEKGDILSLAGWVVTLPAHLQVPGLPLVEEDPTLLSNIRGFVYDSDAVAAYPTCTAVGNVSRGTTKRELIDIEGVDEEMFRKQNLNLVMGATNAIEYTCSMFNFPTPLELLTHFTTQQ